MKRILSLLLILCFSACVLPAFGEGAEDNTEEAVCYDFRLSARLNTEAFPRAQQQKAQGYAALADSLRIEGSFSRAVEGGNMSLDLSIIPLDSAAAPIDLHIHGVESCLYITSPLLGPEEVAFSANSWLEFAAKIYEHMEIPLQNIAFLYPYVWKKGLEGIFLEWDQMIDGMKNKSTISASLIADLEKNLLYEYENSHFLEVLFASLGLDTGYDVYEFVNELPAWFREDVTGGKSIRITRKGTRQTWSSAGSDFFVRDDSPACQTVTVSVPATPSGYLPSLDYQRAVDGDVSSVKLGARIAKEADDDMLNLQFDADRLPLTWPADCDSSLSFSLTGGLFPEVVFSLTLKGAADGSFTAQIVSPSGDASAAPLLTFAGTVTPRAEPVRIPVFDVNEVNSCTDILRVNDVTLAEFISKIVRPAVLGLVNFLVGIPTSACQAVLDDLTDSGILGTLVGGY